MHSMARKEFALPAMTATFITKPGSCQCSRLKPIITTYTRKVGVVNNF